MPFIIFCTCKAAKEEWLNKLTYKLFLFSFWNMTYLQNRLSIYKELFNLTCKKFKNKLDLWNHLANHQKSIFLLKRETKPKLHFINYEMAFLFIHSNYTSYLCKTNHWNDTNQIISARIKLLFLHSHKTSMILIQSNFCDKFCESFVMRRVVIWFFFSKLFKITFVIIDRWSQKS